MVRHAFRYPPMHRREKGIAGAGPNADLWCMAMFRRHLLALLCLTLALRSWATHNRAGEIIYCHQNGLTYYVEIITHTKTSAPADRDYLVIYWGDGTSDTLQRQMPITFYPADDAQRNVYPGQHTYNGPGTFTLSVEDPNRNSGVLNIPNSVAEVFCVKSQLIISPVMGNNCSVRFLNPPLQDACLQKHWEHNPVAYDPDGDSLSYELITCAGYQCDPIADYQFPDGIAPGPDNQFSLDPLNGTITWDAAQQIGEYNIAIRVNEWRTMNGITAQVGYVIRDMQITVLPCDNDPPVVEDLADTCVTAGTFLSLNVDASDPDFGDLVTLSALGEPFVVATSPATFTSPIPGNSVTGIFNWATSCAHVRTQPYQAVFQATDNDPDVPLQDYSTLFITIVAPRPENPGALPSGATITLEWDASPCTNAAGYAIYRRSGLYGFTPDDCETGVPAYTGYQFIDSVSGWATTTYVDDDPALVFGNQYCYMVVARFANGALSYASEEFCAILNRQVPIPIKASVGVTDPGTGIDTVCWSNAYDLDTVQHPGPYLFKLYRGYDYTTATDLILTTGTHPFLAHPDTCFIDLDLDTESIPHVYRVELYGDGGSTFIGSGSPASTVFLTLEPNDEQLTLHFNDSTPWQNTSYEVHKWDGSAWVFLGTTSTTIYVDTGLVNGEEYCYYAISTGAYSDTNIVAPLRNWSQEACGVPVDLTPPCPPTLAIDNDCEEPLNTLTWTNPNSTCADDTWRYNIWFTDSIGGEYVLIATITGATDTVFEHVFGSSVAGCYVVTAIDSVGNESAYSNEVCGDNCPQYELPNVFTPNGDILNDLFVPFPDYRGVKKIELTVFNRWGQVVFTTEDPAIQWNGVHRDSNEPVSEGVYFYTCTVTFARLAGDQNLQLNGYVHLLRGSTPTTN